MEQFYNDLIQYLEELPQEALEQTWNEVKHLNKFGPDVEIYAESIKKMYGFPTSTQIEFECHREEELSFDPVFPLYLAA